MKKKVEFWDIGKLNRENDFQINEKRIYRLIQIINLNLYAGERKNTM
ncbi:hypothetical protein [Alkalibaculum sporogenes]|nr:hypothetical protein [Alkalibaculum sporogenes]